MPPSTKRSVRTRRETINKTDVPDSSPSRPAKRRRKIQLEEPAEKTEPEEPEPEPEPESEQIELPYEQKGIAMGDDELVATVARHLAIPSHEVKAIEENSNTIHEKVGAAGVQAYAKLSGNGWTFYVKKLNNVIGRPPEGVCQRHDVPVDSRVGALDTATEPEGGVHVNLGPNKMVSRNHAEILYNSDTEKWNIVVTGRNGLKVNNSTLRRGDSRALSSGAVIEIGGVEMMFVMPNFNEPLVIHKMYLQRAGLIQVDDEKTDEEDGDGQQPMGSSGSSGHRGNNGTQGGPLPPIAPAPPDYRRPGTPVSGQTKGAYSAGKSPYLGSTMVMNSDDVDLTLDQNKHIKPTFSYAQLITQAILSGDNEKQTLANIYKYITDKFSYYRHQPAGGWQNSIRHNLSLHKAFSKSARSTDEPGKGMKWYIRDEHRDEMIRTAFSRGRGGHRGSPGSPNVRSHNAREAGDSSVQRSRSKRSHSVSSPPVSSYPSGAPQFTPDRAAGSIQDDVPGDGSPLPRHKRSQGAAYGLSDNAPGSPPVLPSSYAQEEGSSFVTPAPHRVHPRLAPPSTAQRPSQHMPTSSPAPFWKYAEYGGTPLRGSAFDLSPTKPSQPGSTLAPSSSPAPVRRSSAASPTRNGAPAKQDELEDGDDEDKGFDLAKGFQSIGSYHAPANSVAVGPALNGR